jgi:hypothetical protein
MPRINNERQKATTQAQELGRGLVDQVRMFGEMTDRCRANSPALAELRYNLHTVALAQGVGRYCARNRWPGVHRGRVRECFKNAAHLSLRDDRYVYCEGYAVRPSLCITVGLHAWVLDRERGWEVIDPTWRDTAGSAYLGVPFSHKFLTNQLVKNGHYGLIDVWSARHPVLRLDPAEYLHADAASIPKDFEP